MHPSPHVGILRFGALGDCVHALLAAASIKRARPKAQLYGLTTAPFIPLWQASGYFHEVVALHRTKSRLQDLHYNQQVLTLLPLDHICDFQNSHRTRDLFWVTRVLGPRRQTWSGTFWGAQPNVHLSRFHQTPWWVRMAHHLDALDIPMRQTFEGDQWAVPQVDIKKPYVVLAPESSGAMGGTKQWAEDRWEQVARTLGKTMTVVVVGQNSAMHQDLQALPDIRSMVGVTSLLALTALLQQADLVVSLDSGPMHLAALWGVPTVGLFGPTRADLIAAPVPNWIAVQGADMAAIQVADVLRAIEGLSLA